MEASQTHKWLLFVVDGSTAMAPHWPIIFSNYIYKIVRHCCSKWRQPEANGAKVELGLVMYNVEFSDLEWAIQGSRWTTNEDEFLEKLSTLSFNGSHGSGSGKSSSMTQGLSEALVVCIMFPKPPIGSPSREYLDGERHCIVVPSTAPSTSSMAVHVPKFRHGRLYGSHTDSGLANYRAVAQIYPPLGVSLSVISPCLFLGWIEIFQLANNYRGIPLDSAFTSAHGRRFTVLISQKYRDVRDALIPQETRQSSSHHQNLTNSQHSIPCFFSDEEANILIWKVMHDETIAQNSPAEAAQAMNETNQQGAVEQEKTGIISLETKDPPLLDGKINEASTSQQNTPATQISVEAATAADLQDGSIPEWPVPQKKDGIVEPLASSSYSPLLSLDPGLYEDIMAEVNACADEDENYIWNVLNEVKSEYLKRTSENPLLLQDKTNETPTSQLYTSATQISPEAPTAADLRNIDGIDASVCNDIAADLNARGGIRRPQDLASLQPHILDKYNQSHYLPPRQLHSLTGSGLEARPFTLMGARGNNDNINENDAQARSTVQVQKPNYNNNNNNNEHAFSSSYCGNSSGRRQRRRREPLSSGSVAQLTRGPMNHPQLPPSPLPIPAFVMTWEGAICTGGNLNLFVKAKAYRKITAYPTLTATWPQWLQISCVIAQSAVSGSSIFQVPVADLVFETIMRNNDNKLFEILSTNNLCASIDLPSQTLILTPTTLPYRFYGTLIPREFHVAQSTHAYGSQWHRNQQKPMGS